MSGRSAACSRTWSRATTGLGVASLPKPVFSELKLSEEDVAEIDFRFDALKPFLKPEPFAKPPRPARDEPVAVAAG